MALQFFLGANSRDGFVSLFPQLQKEQSRRLYLVKSGPGSGKSTCIRRLAEGLGGPEEWIFCSSDPDSLDGAVREELAVLDGTAPHVFEPNFPGCDGDYLPMPPYRDTRGLEAQAPALYALQGASRRRYQQAYRLIAAAAQVREERRAAAAALLPAGLPEKRAASLLRREVPRKTGPGRLRLRFLDGVTPKGLLFLSDSVTRSARRIIALRDSFGLAQPLLERLRDGALAQGQLVYACLDPVEPERILHLLLPEAGVAFVTQREKELPFRPARSVRIDAMLPAQELRALRGRLRLLGNMEQSLLNDAVEQIAAAHALHDRMEDIYRPHLRLEAMEDHYRDLLARLRQEDGEEEQL